ncbi:Rv2175c family DNA-binding protein [Nocardioides sp. Kera G14]|uniref:Rv2175c family DNA-binding protein n=1 Tax=Nocardioides sp. Kera G14 TaxID=2884264 RepID=UPI001D124B63|nr:Rv2175c family DNA-binding protein [Nocardioides sp. Kera G14]UDY22505.1 transcriptional regulator [Nocardioides sp. Kera G14]
MSDTDGAPRPLPLAEHDLSALVEDWLEWSEAADLLGVTVGSVRTLVREHQLAQAVPVTGGKGVRIPALFFQNGEIVKGLSGLITMLHDGRYDDREIIAWLFLEQPDLPGRPIDALRENRGAETKRRAQAMAL